MEETGLPSAWGSLSGWETQPLPLGTLNPTDDEPSPPRQKQEAFPRESS